METKVGDLWYRYEDRRYGSDVSLNLLTYVVIKVTPKGVWVNLKGSFQPVPGIKESHTTVNCEQGNFLYYDKHFVLMDSRKQFASPSEKDALTAYMARKLRQHAILQSQLNAVDLAIKKGNALLNPDADQVLLKNSLSLLNVSGRSKVAILQ